MSIAIAYRLCGIAMDVLNFLSRTRGSMYLLHSGDFNSEAFNAIVIQAQWYCISLIHIKFRPNCLCPFEVVVNYHVPNYHEGTETILFEFVVLLNKIELQIWKRCFVSCLGFQRKSVLKNSEVFINIFKRMIGSQMAGNIFIQINLLLLYAIDASLSMPLIP